MASEFTDSEKQRYAEFINSSFVEDADLKADLPLNTTKLFEVIAEGVLLCKMIHKWFPESISLAKLVTKVNKPNRTPFEINLNHDLAITAARKIGCTVVNIGGADLQEKKEVLCLGLLWQIIKAALLKNLKNEALDPALSHLPPEQLLLRWFNNHLENAKFERRVANFSTDIRDSKAYAALLRQIAPDRISDEDVAAVLAEEDLLARAERVLELAGRLGCRRFVSAQDILDGNPRLNLAFVADLFNAFPAMGPTREELAMKKVKDLESSLALAYDSIETSKIAVTQLETRVAETSAELDEQRRINAELAQRLTLLTAELEQERVEKLSIGGRQSEQNAVIEGLLKRIAELEAEIERLKKEYAEAMRIAAEDKERSMEQLRREAENILKASEEEREREVERLRNLLQGASRQGVMYKQGHGNLTANKWSKRYFVLKDNMLAYYKSASGVEKQKPLGIIYLDEARLYEHTDEAKAGKKKFSFELATPNKTYNMACKSLAETRDWMHEIRLAKKKTVAGDIVAQKKDERTRESMSLKALPAGSAPGK